MYYAYILKSIKDNRYYYGHTENLEKRLMMHNKGKVLSTKDRRPSILHYYEDYSTKREATRREYFFKTIDGYNFLKSKKII